MECLTEERYEHVLRVADTAKKLAERFAIPVEKAEQAALFHDIAKCMDKSELHQILEREKEDPRLFLFHHELWHAPVGAIIARDEFAISDADILNAIRYHTTGRSEMTAARKAHLYRRYDRTRTQFSRRRNFKRKSARKSKYSNGSLHLSVGALSCE